VLYGTMQRAMQDYLDVATPAVAFYHAGRLNEAWDFYQANGGIANTALAVFSFPQVLSAFCVSDMKSVSY
jgi:hypothetical protein